jgi:hypothetical protein
MLRSIVLLTGRFSNQSGDDAAFDASSEVRGCHFAPLRVNALAARDLFHYMHTQEHEYAAGRDPVSCMHNYLNECFRDAGF